MNQTEILSELSRLKPHERRLLAKRLLELASDAESLRDADGRADERFPLLDQLQADDGQDTPG